jgi:hypothetical protein
MNDWIRYVTLASCAVVISGRIAAQVAPLIANAQPLK